MSVVNVFQFCIHKAFMKILDVGSQEDTHNRITEICISGNFISNLSTQNTKI